MSDNEDERVEKNVRHAAGISALRKIGRIVAQEQRADAEKAAALRWFARYGWMALLGAALLLAYLLGVF
ncbi:MAG TPA: hypothetical protein VGD24_02725 [Gallionella sp.]